MLFALAVLGFFLGSIPFGVIVSRAKGVDIFSVGSGNIGATNVVRALGPVFGTLVFLLDVVKGYVPGLLGHFFIHGDPYGIDRQVWYFVLGCFAMIGHMYSPWIKFKGGKGIATGLGATLSSMPATGLTALLVMILVTALTRYVSLGSIVAGLATIPISYFLVKDSPQVLPVLAVLNVFVIYKHRANIRRLRNGTENKFRFRKSEDNEKKEPGDQNHEVDRP